jgi:hypothetical protein
MKTHELNKNIIVELEEFVPHTEETARVYKM